MIARLPPATAPRSGTRRRLLDALKTIPAGCVVTLDTLAGHLAISKAEVATLVSNLTEDERQSAPWHRIVAKGGAIGRGPWRERQFELLAREGVLLSPAGIVQDLPARAVVDLSDPPRPPAPQAHSAPLNRSRGMKDRP